VVRGAIPGILGNAVGVLCIAVISSTGLAVVLATSALAFSVVKLFGAAYLIYLGIKMWLSSTNLKLEKIAKPVSHRIRFTEGLLITLLNPKTIFFFLAFFPQFIVQNDNYLRQFLTLATMFGILTVIIHCLYALFSKAAKSSLSTPEGSKVMGRVSGSLYMFFGVGLALSNKQV
jgi:homoserine/homoserine lactone efflux protein